MTKKTMTVNIDEKVESEFRKQATVRYGKGKGSPGKTITEAMEEWIRKSESDIETKSLEMLKEGIKMKKWKFKREELYEK